MKINSLSSSLNLRLQKTEQLEPLANSSQVGAVRQVQNSPSDQKAEPQVQPEATIADVEVAVNDVNKVLRYMNERLEFSVHETTNRIMVRVLDRATDEVLREIPPEQLLDLVAKLQELVGLLVDKRA